ncbi:MAG: exodeoxyribonuclease VII large subunit [Christensenellaceae bacterium]|jgi:exodeoxyribonuclease VII large subunit|nr:exodeoxyribonuclease VII large subunit [Christensenellaceae bacterium]
MKTNVILTVSELNKYIHRIINFEDLLQDCSVSGEVSETSIKNGTLYFTLKDKDARIKAIAFDCLRKYCPKNGESVVVVGTPNYYEKLGQISFIAKSIEPQGLGLMFLEIEKLKIKLEKEGLFSEKYKKAIPRYPLSVGIVTSDSGAVKQDIIATIRKKNKAISLTIIDVQVQGTSAPRSVIDGLLRADSAGFDVIILARGGGSVEELMPFNDENLARIIFSLDTPIISAVGHETNFSISDFVADARAATPTAAAELVGFSTQEVSNTIIRLLDHANLLITNKLREKSFKVEQLKGVVYNICNEKIRKIKELVLVQLSKIRFNVKALLDTSTKRTHELTAQLSVLDPNKVLKNGYFKVEKGDNVVFGISELSIDETIVLIGHDGKATAVVTGKSEHKVDNS